MEDAIASAARELSGTVGSVIASRWSPATSETVRLTSRAGAAAAASRPPLNAETCLRTALTSTIAIPEDSSSSCRRASRPRVTPGRRQAGEGRAAAGEAGDHEVAARARLARSSSARAAAIERSLGRGWSEPITSTRSSSAVLAARTRSRRRRGGRRGSLERARDRQRGLARADARSRAPAGIEGVAPSSTISVAVERHRGGGGPATSQADQAGGRDPQRRARAARTPRRRARRSPRSGRRPAAVRRAAAGSTAATGRSGGDRRAAKVAPG